MAQATDPQQEGVLIAQEIAGGNTAVCPGRLSDACLWSIRSVSVQPYLEQGHRLGASRLAMPKMVGVFSLFGVILTPKSEKTQFPSPHGARSALVRDTN
jgi:hypothetical protein